LLKLNSAPLHFHIHSHPSAPLTPSPQGGRL
jgi:hypothetical protein